MQWMSAINDIDLMEKMNVAFQKAFKGRLQLGGLVGCLKGWRFKSHSVPRTRRRLANASGCWVVVGGANWR